VELKVRLVVEELVLVVVVLDLLVVLEEKDVVVDVELVLLKVENVESVDNVVLVAEEVSPVVLVLVVLLAVLKMLSVALLAVGVALVVELGLLDVDTREERPGVATTNAIMTTATTTAVASKARVFDLSTADIQQTALWLDYCQLRERAVQHFRLRDAEPVFQHRRVGLSEVNVVVQVAVRV